MHEESFAITKGVVIINTTLLDPDLLSSIEDDIDQVFHHLKTVINSCSEHDVLYDIFMSSADGVAYRFALGEIDRHISRISSANISREELLLIICEADIKKSKDLSRIIEPKDFVRFLGVTFTQTQQEQILKVCLEWALAAFPSDPEWMAGFLSSAIRPVTLVDLLSPERTRMQRFPLLLLLQDARDGHALNTKPDLVTNDSIPIQFIDDSAVFIGEIHTALFRFLVQNRYLPGSFFERTSSQTLHDIGILQAEGRSGIERIYRDEGVVSAHLVETGRELFHTEGVLCDLRQVYQRVSGVMEQPPLSSMDSPLSWLELKGGHVLAGYLAASAEHGEGQIITSFIEFIRTIASRSTGRVKPDKQKLHGLLTIVQEMEQLIRVITGDYRWRGVPVPQVRESYHPVVELYPQRNLLLYEPEELAYKSRSVTLAFTMEALYRHWHIQPFEGEEKLDSWLRRLMEVVFIPRAVARGRLLHPGANRWLEQLRIEEYDPPSRVVKRIRYNHMSPPDQFLYAVLFEGRTGEDERDLMNISVLQALDATRRARRRLVDTDLNDEGCQDILMNQIWPEFMKLCYPPVSASSKGTVTQSGTNTSNDLTISPHGEAPRVDKSVSSPHKPLDPTTGKTIAGDASDHLEDDGFSIPGGSSGDSTGQTGNQTAPPPGGKGGSSPSEGGGNGASGNQNPGAGIQKIADKLVEACERSRELINDPESDFSALLDLADTIHEQVKDLEEELRRHLGSRPHDQESYEEEWEGLLKLSEDIKKAARNYQDAVEEQERETSTAGSGFGTSGSRTGMTKDALIALQNAGAEFQLLAGASFPSISDDWRARVSFEDLPDDTKVDELQQNIRKQKYEPAFMADAIDNEEFWENLAYYDAIYGDETETEKTVFGESPRDNADRQYRQSERALSREAEQYLTTLQERTQDDWETIEEKAERIRKVALFETHSVGEDDYNLYQRFYQPVAGLVGVARKNIQQSLQKNASSRDMTELLSGDDIDEENLAAVRTTMRIFKDSAREHDRTRWLISLLIDASSSMHDETVAKKLEATIKTAILFGEAVSRIEDLDFEIAAFADTEYIPLKRYQDEWNIHQACYLIRQIIRASGGTNDVGALGSALDRMKRQRMASGANRMIFILSDGQSGVGGREQMRKILAGNKDTRIFGWGVGPDMEEIEETYKPYGTWIPDITDLPGSIGEVLRRELSRPAMTGWKEHSPSSDDEEIQENRKDL